MITWLWMKEALFSFSPCWILSLRVDGEMRSGTCYRHIRELTWVGRFAWQGVKKAGFKRKHHRSGVPSPGRRTKVSSMEKMSSTAKTRRTLLLEEAVGYQRHKHTLPAERHTITRTLLSGCCQVHYLYYFPVRKRVSHSLVLLCRDEVTMVIRHSPFLDGYLLYFVPRKRCMSKLFFYANWRRTGDCIYFSLDEWSAFLYALFLVFRRLEPLPIDNFFYFPTLFVRHLVSVFPHYLPQHR